MKNDNVEKYMALVKALDPELYEIKIALLETKVNPNIVPTYIRAVSNLFYGTGFGKVQTFMQDGVVTNVNFEEKVKMELDAVLLDKTG